MKYALIGCGRIAPNHIGAALENGLEIAAVCDIVKENADALAARFKLPETVKFYADYREMLDSERPELTAVATESGKHAAVALDCIAAGSNIIVEKPIALSLSDADAVISAAKSKGVKLCANHQNRFNKSVQYIRGALEAGRFGSMTSGTANIRWYRDRDYYSQAAWRGTWAQDGGALMNQCIHTIDLLRWMMGGGIEEVFAYTDRLRHDYIEAEDFGAALIKFTNGAYGIVEGTTDAFPRDFEGSLALFGEKGAVKAGGMAADTVEEWRFGDDKDGSEAKKILGEFHTSAPNVYGYGHTPLYADMIDAINTGREPYVTGKDGRDALELVLAIYKSAAEGRPVRLPLGETATTDFTGRFDKK